MLLSWNTGATLHLPVKHIGNLLRRELLFLRFISFSSPKPKIHLHCKIIPFRVLVTLLLWLCTANVDSFYGWSNSADAGFTAELRVWNADIMTYTTLYHHLETGSTRFKLISYTLNLKHTASIYVSKTFWKQCSLKSLLCDSFIFGRVLLLLPLITKLGQ